MQKHHWEHYPVLFLAACILLQKINAHADKLDSKKLITNSGQTEHNSHILRVESISKASEIIH